MEIEQNLQIVKIPIDEITPYENNAKMHPTEQVAQIVDSIVKNGFCDPVAVWGKDNIIVEGHGRLLALQQLGVNEVPCIRLDHLSDEQRRAYTLEHNKLTMNSGFDMELLNLELDELADLDIDVIGFDADENINIDDFFEDKDEISEKEAKEIQCPHCKEWFTP